MALAIIRRGTSPIPIGRTPGRLSSGISRQATNGINMAESIVIVDRQRATEDNESVTPQVVPRHNWSGRTIHGRFGCHRWSALQQVVPPFILLQMPNTGSLATCLLPSIIYMAKYKAAVRGMATGAFYPGPHAAYGPQKIDIL